MYRGSHRDGKTSEIKVIMEKSWSMEEFAKGHGILLVLLLDFTKFVKYSISPESPHFLPYLYHKMSQIQNLSREMVMDNKKNCRGKVIEKSEGTMMYIFQKLTSAFGT